ncbi:MAG: AraC-like DNA-binding protein, partial [Cocleimonas sp.]
VGSEGHVLFDLAHHDGQYARVAKVLTRMHQAYSEGLTVQQLAEEANMSVSAFHLAFRKVTLESPLQYLKKVRLNKAKELIQLEGLRVNDAARLVGYSSSSQFSREFKRHFNMTPKGSTH